MSRTSRHLAGHIFLLLSLTAAASPTPSPRSVSASRQFIVYGRDSLVRGAVCDLAERTKKSVLEMLKLPDRWTTPIVVDARYPQADSPDVPPARLNFSQTGFGLKLQLDLRIGADLNGPQVERELLRAIFLEIIYRQEPNTPAGTPYVQPPDWLLDGTIALATNRDDRGFAEILASPIASARILSLEELLRQNPALLDSPSRALYRAYAAAFISMLIDLPGGRAELARFVAGLSRASNDPVADLLLHFPVLGDRETMEKTWTQTLARLPARERYRFLGCAETERELARILRVEIADQGERTAYALEEFPTFLRKPTSRKALQQPARELLVLSARANPLYRAVIAEYQEIVTRLSRGRTKKIAARLAEARGMREQLTRRMGAIDDYMDWFEATQARTASGAFREYLRAAERAAEPEPRRRDPISVYLDSLEAQFGN